jgi:hypothetical protein
MVAIGEVDHFKGDLIDKAIEWVKGIDELPIEPTSTPAVLNRFLESLI